MIQRLILHSSSAHCFGDLSIFSVFKFFNCRRKAITRDYLGVTNGRALDSLGVLGHIPQKEGGETGVGRYYCKSMTSRRRFAQSGTGGSRFSFHYA